MKTLPRLSSLSERLQFARARAGFASPRKAAKQFGWNENTYKSHENGVRGARSLPEIILKKYARAFGVPWEWLATGQSQTEGPSQADTAEIVHIWDKIDPQNRPQALRVLEAFAERPEKKAPKNN